MTQKSSNEDDIELQVAWFYRPEEAVGGRKVRGLLDWMGPWSQASTQPSPAAVDVAAPCKCCCC